VLEEGNHDEVVVDDEVRKEVVSEDSAEAVLHAENGEGGASDKKTDVGGDDLAKVALVENGRLWVEVWRVG
jgi:hypothetical protein